MAQRTAEATIRFSAPLSVIDTSTVLRLPEKASNSRTGRPGDHEPCGQMSTFHTAI